jgi:hypothetical protein
MLDRLFDDGIAANVASIANVPRDVLPDGPARAMLNRMAALGHDVYCYQPAGGTLWNVWLEDTRLTMAQFIAQHFTDSPAT